MARLLEHTAKRLLQDAGLPVPVFRRASSPDEARRAAMDVGGRCVVKALVPGNRRGIAGGVRFCDTPDDAHQAATALLGSILGTYSVDAVIVETRMDIVRELYLAFELGGGRPLYRLLLSGQGGVNVEASRDAIVLNELDPNNLPTPVEFDALWDSVCLETGRSELGELTSALAEVFVRHDLTLLEVNPLAVLADGGLCCVGALMSVDDNALTRQPVIQSDAVAGSDLAMRPETDLERRVSLLNQDTSQRGSARYLELDGGDIGFLCGGGGASLLLFDAIVAAGGHPANYSEFGGNPTEQRVYDLTRFVLAKPGVKGLFLAHNLTNNTQVDVVAAGVIRALKDFGAPQPFPVVAREAGLHDEEARQLFERAGVVYFGEQTTLDQAARHMVAAMRSAGY